MIYQDIRELFGQLRHPIDPIHDARPLSLIHQEGGDRRFFALFRFPRSPSGKVIVLFPGRLGDFKGHVKIHRAIIGIKPKIAGF